MSFWKKPLIHFRSERFEFSLSLWWILLVLIFVPLLARLGLWQLDRAAEREQAMKNLAVVLTQPPVSITDMEINDREVSLVRTEVKGEIDWSRQFLLENQVHNTVSGYEVLVPMVFAPGQAILVSRGWLPPSPGKKPNLSPPQGMSSRQAVKGFAVIPPPRLADFQREILDKSGDFRVLDVNPEHAQWPVLIQEEDFPKLSALLQLELVPRVLQSAQDLPYGYARVWKPAARGPAVNYGYAAQWFGMALLLIGAMIGVNLRRIKHRQDS